MFFAALAADFFENIGIILSYIAFLKPTKIKNKTEKIGENPKKNWKFLSYMAFFESVSVSYLFYELYGL